MEINSGNMGAVIIKRVPAANIGEFSLDGQMLSVLMEVDGQQSVGAIAKKLGMDMASIKAVLKRLLDTRLVEIREDALSILDAEFMRFLKTRLSLAIGPIAEILIEDACGDLGCTMERFPSHRAAELVDLLARQIRREDRMTSFKKEMLAMIRKKGY